MRYLGIEDDDTIEIAKKIDNQTDDAIFLKADTVGVAMRDADCVMIDVS